MDLKIEIFLGILVTGIVLFGGCIGERTDTTTTTIAPDTTTTTIAPDTTTTTTVPQKNGGTDRDSCTKNIDCVPAQCCHPTSCVNRKFAPDRTGIMCTMVCQGPIDCGAGRCVCKNNKCVVESMRESPHIPDRI